MTLQKCREIASAMKRAEEAIVDLCQKVDDGRAYSADLAAKLDAARLECEAAGILNAELTRQVTDLGWRLEGLRR